MRPAAERPCDGGAPLKTRDGGLTPPTFPEATQSQDELDDVLAEQQGLP